MPAETRKRKEEKAQKSVTDIEETKSKEDKRALRASAKKKKSTQKVKETTKILTLEDSFTRMIRIIKGYGIYKG